MENDFFKSRPQRLCHMCGKCCRVSTTAYSYEELKKLASQGEEGAIDFLKIFEPYPSIEEAKKYGEKTVNNIINGLKENDAYDENNLTFYRCRYITDNNLCSIYENRPELCDRFPSSPWAVVPPGCGFEGWLFQQREFKKQQVRKLKEYLLDVETMLLDLKDLEQIEKTKEAIEKVKKTIEFYGKYGSADW